MIPCSVDASLEHRPIANWIIFGSLILVFIIKSRLPEATVEPFALHNWDILGLFTHNWLHKNIVHFILNLLFLWPFGNAVCGKIGSKYYLAVFLGFNLAGGIIHAVFSDIPAVAPCAAICAIVGMYLVFFPENTMSCFFLLPRPIFFDVPGGFIVFIWFVADLVTTFWGVQAVTYPVHILSFAGGLGIAVLMLKKKWILMAKDEKSILQMLGLEKEQIQELIAEDKTEGPAQAGGKDKPTAGPEEKVEKPQLKPQASVIRFDCPCGRQIKVPAEYAGRTGRCPQCKKPVKIPHKSI